MSTLREQVSKVRTKLKLVSNDIHITDRAIAASLRDAAYLLIKRETDKRKLFSSDNIFTEISCLKMQEASLSECCEYNGKCTIAKSINKIPKIGENIYGLLVQGVFSIDYSVKFEYTDPDRYANLLKIYPNKKHKFFWRRNGYLYISDPNIEIVNLRAFFEDDIEHEKYSSCNENGQKCPDNPLDLEFKCPGYLQKAVIDMVVEDIGKPYKSSVEDKTDDDQDTSK